MTQISIPFVTSIILCATKIENEPTFFSSSAKQIYKKLVTVFREKINSILTILDANEQTTFEFSKSKIFIETTLAVALPQP